MARFFFQTLVGYEAVHAFSAPRLNNRSCLPNLPLQKLAGASVLIFANKQDLAGALSQENIATSLDLRSEQFENRHWTIKGCSAVTGEGLVDGIDWMVADIASRIFMLS